MKRSLNEERVRSIATRVAFPLAAAAFFALLRAQPAGAQDITAYAKECARKIAPVQEFDCLKGVEIPITVNLQPPPGYQPQMNCDRPSLLYQAGENTDGSCVPFSRAIVLRDDAQAQIVAICREKKIRDRETKLFDEVDVISHNVHTGSTCWFQAQAGEPLAPNRGLFGTRVPSPEEPIGKKFWNTPAVTAKGNCVTCHDSDPFMYSPYIAQTRQLPADPFGKYANDIGAVFRAWEKPSAISTRGNTCVGCHRIANLTTCRQTVREAVGIVTSRGSDDWARQYPNSHWMPPGNSMTEKQWDQIYSASVQKIFACCANPKAPECEITPIRGALPQK
ncbi:MAG TPA: hypothetical protein VLW83_11190 [Candidatus Acidoferrales bacterium]|nr:hypothetical protein [Candidatus Acidoferrales bacterium]